MFCQSCGDATYEVDSKQGKFLCLDCQSSGKGSDKMQPYKLLLPCPFCGGAAELVPSRTADNTWLVRCTNPECQCKTVNKYGKTAPCTVWNKRERDQAIIAPAQDGDVQCQFYKWWEANQVDPAHGMITQNCALASWHAAYEKYVRLGLCPECEGAKACPTCSVPNGDRA